MPGSWSDRDFPNLNDESCKITSPVMRRYNCVAWAMDEDFRWWWPDPMGVGYWPSLVPREVTIEAFVEAFASLGYEICASSLLEAEADKIAIFGRKDYTGFLVPTHAARQLESGEWTSKLGSLEDISHLEANAVGGTLYGSAVLFMRRQRS